ncbi:chromobox protein 1-like protein [Leptotrombidium deliense]|uniref:Chromobox protein 1-like protein n=1 Tax=Leptotrombidium deliense TaxID=299467 RepID=A0A443S6H5_9ACAR|nr:chromobox protein 1-like protein [Leptotrombidium deliense]
MKVKLDESNLIDNSKGASMDSNTCESNDENEKFEEREMETEKVVNVREESSASEQDVTLPSKRSVSVSNIHAVWSKCNHKTGAHKMFVVDKVLNKIRRNGRAYYLIKWAHSKNELCWLRQDYVKNNQVHVIDEFNKQLSGMNAKLDESKLSSDNSEGESMDSNTCESNEMNEKVEEREIETEKVVNVREESSASEGDNDIESKQSQVVWSKCNHKIGAHKKFVIHKVLNKTFRNGKSYYLIKWTHSENELCWQRRDYINNNQVHLVDKFNKQLNDNQMKAYLCEHISSSDSESESFNSDTSGEKDENIKVEKKQEIETEEVNEESSSSEEDKVNSKQRRGVTNFHAVWSKCSHMRGAHRMFVVDKVLNKSRHNGHAYYLIKWKHSKTELCWIRSDHLKKKVPLFDEFYKQMNGQLSFAKRSRICSNDESESESNEDDSDSSDKNEINEQWWKCSHRTIDHKSFTVEKVLDKRSWKKHAYYLVKWEHSDFVQCWVQKHSVEKGLDLLLKFDTKYKKHKSSSKSSKMYSNEDIEKNIRDADVHSILGALSVNDSLCFIVKWVDSTEASIVPSHFINEKHPNLLISFYEQRLQWKQELNYV